MNDLVDREDAIRMAQRLVFETAESALDKDALPFAMTIVTRGMRKEQTMNELKRCPFCGDEVEIRPTGLYHWRYAIHHKTKTECILDTTGMVVPLKRDQAIRLWNERSADRPQGEWKHLKGDEWLCSNCGYVVWTEGSWEHPLERGKDYCEHCGAQMKERASDEFINCDSNRLFYGNLLQIQ